MDILKVIPVGATVKIDGHLEAVVIAVCIFPEDRIDYKCAWWDGDIDRSAWFDGFRVSTEDINLKEIGFNNETSKTSNNGQD